MSGRPWVRLFVCLLLLSGLSGEAAEPLRIDGRRQSLAGHLEAFLEPDETRAVEVIQDASFQPLPGEATFGYQRDVLWLRFRLEWPATPIGERWLEVPSNLLDRVDLYRQDAQGRWAEQRNGRDIPFSRRPLPLRHPSFRLPGGPAGVEVVYLRVASRGSINVEPILWDPPALAAVLAREDFWEGLAAGLLFLLAVTHLSLGIAMQDRTNAIYACYTAISLITMLSYGGFFGALVAPETPRWDWWILALAAPALMAIVWPMFSAITDFRERQPRLDRTLTWGSLLMGSVFAISRLAGFNVVVGPLYSALYLLLLLGVFLAACWQVLAGNIPARFYLLAFAPLLLLLGHEVAHNMGMPKIDAFSSHGFAIMANGHLIILNLPVVLSLLRVKRERDEVVARELQASLSNARQLEAMVAERTQELQVAKAQAEGALASAKEVLEGQRLLIQTVSHEFRTPLAIIDGTAQLLEFESAPEPFGKPSPAATIRAKVRRLLDFLDGTLRQNQLESGSWRMVREPMDPVNLLQTVLARVQADSNAHFLSLSLDQVPGQFAADTRMLSILLVNLIENAIRYSPQGGEICIDAEGLPDGSLRIFVSDQGIGIPPEHLDRVFDRFYRTNQLPGVDGSGLGLYLSREIARMHGGELAVESRLGRGTTFTLTLPDPAKL